MKGHDFMDERAPVPLGRRHRRMGVGDRKRQAAFLLMLVPGLVFLFCFAYLPMPGIIMAFKKYQLAIPPKGFWLQNKFVYSIFVKNAWVGLDNFKYLISSPDAWMITRNTIGYNLLFMTFGLVSSVAVAVGINELRNRRAAKLYHTILFMPYFVSWIVVAYVVYALVSDRGLFNQFALAMGNSKTNYYASKGYWPYLFLAANLWKYTGNNSIIYLATITGFDQQLYEAGAIDGAGKWKQFRYITLPQLVPVIVLLQILAVGRIFYGDFDMFYSLPNGSGPLRNVSTTIDVYVYNMMKNGQQLGYSAAAALFQSVVGFVLVLGTNLIVRRVSPEMSLF